MSASGEFDLAGNHYFNGVLADIGIAPDDHCAKEAVWYLYQLAIAEYSEQKNSVTARTMAASDILAKVKTRYGLLIQYENSFYPLDHSYDRTALIGALILDGVINEIEDDQEKPVVMAAKAIWKQSVNFEEYGYDAEFKEMPEALFLSHVNMMERLLLAERIFDELDAYDMREFLNDEIPKIKERAQRYSLFGLDLAEQAAIAEERFRARLKELTPKPQLRLVVDNTAPPGPSL